MYFIAAFNMVCAQTRKYRGVWGCYTPQSFTQSDNLRVVRKFKAFHKKPGRSDLFQSFVKTKQLDNYSQTEITYETIYKVMLH